MSRSYYGYDAYKGRFGAKSVLTALIVVLFILLLLAVAFFFFAQPYVVYGDDGKAHLEFPFFQSAEATPVPSTPAVVIVTPTPTPEPTPTPGPVLVQLPRSALTDGTAARQVSEAGGTAAVFDMKAVDGTLGYVSGLDMAIHSKVNPGDAGLNRAITALNEGELYTVARVSCFKDDTVPYFFGRWAGFRIPEGNWRGVDGSRWLSPGTQRARDYVAGICRELCELGFDEIWLDWCAFPAKGRLDAIIRGDAYREDALDQDLEAFYTQVKEIVDEYPGVTLALTAEKGVLLGEEGDRSGQTLQLLAEYAQRLYLPIAEEGEDYTAALETVGLPQDRLVYLDGEGAPLEAGRMAEL